MGSLIAAIASYLEARSHSGQWLLRIEDIDPPREQRGAAELIVSALDRYGFEWDGPVLFQSLSSEVHREALQKLQSEGQTYRCTCSRRDLSDEPHGPLGVIYPGTCRQAKAQGDASIRVKTNDEPTSFEDALQGRITQRLSSESGDFVIRRRDGLIAYHLAVVVDDAAQGVTHIVRGIDLMDSTPRQLWLQTLLGLDHPGYSHIPVLVNATGDKLSKLTGAAAISLLEPQQTLVRALALLQQEPPDDLARQPLGTIWKWARENWQIGQLFGLTSLADKS